MRQALDGIARMSPFLDSLLVIRNDQIPKIFPERKFSSFMRLADGILASAAKSIVEIITKNGYINVDFADVCTTLKNGGRTIINFGQASGEHRVTNAIKEAMNTPLLFEYEVEKTKKMLIAVYTSSSNEITAIEMSEIKSLMETLDKDIDFIWGAFFDDSLGDEVKITLIATCSDDNVVPKPIDVMIKNNEYTKIKDRSTLYIEDLDSQELLKQIQEIPAYKRVEGL